MEPSHIELVNRLKQLPERELVEVICEALRSKNEDKTFPDGDFEYDRWCLAQIAFGRFDGRVDDEPYIELIGQVAPRGEPVNWEHLCQSGKCGKCNALITSVSKIAICPCCSTEVECT